MGVLLLFDPARRPVGLGVSVLGLWLGTLYSVHSS